MTPQGGGLGRIAQLEEVVGLRAYLREIRRFPRLTAREEVELAQRMERNEPGARQQMITCNLRLVVAVARRFADGRATAARSHPGGQHGAHARRGALRLAAWIQVQQLCHAVGGSNPSHGPPPRPTCRCGFPTMLHRKLATSRRIWDELRTELQRDPDIGEVARRAGLPTAELARLRRFAARTISLERSLGDDDVASTGPDAEPSPAAVRRAAGRSFCRRTFIAPWPRWMSASARFCACVSASEAASRSVW